MTDTIKMGRRGVAPGFVNQIWQRWNTSEVRPVGGWRPEQRRCGGLGGDSPDLP